MESQKIDLAVLLGKENVVFPPMKAENGKIVFSANVKDGMKNPLFTLDYIADNMKRFVEASGGLLPHIVVINVYGDCDVSCKAKFEAFVFRMQSSLGDIQVNYMN